MRYSRKVTVLLILFLPVLVILSCRKQDKLSTSPGLMLSFSSDTVFFDTIFPTIGSVTERLVVHNPNDNKIRISNIRLAAGQSSAYRININGTPAISESDIEIPGGDSLFIFVRVTIDPNSQNIPFIVSDSLEFVTNGNYQNVKLVAWGRNADFHRNGTIRGTVTWDSLKAHVIFGSLRVDTNSTLIMLPGTRVYFHKDAGMTVSYRSTLKINGTVDHPVRIQGDRTDQFYENLSGQWDGIHLEQGSQDHEIYQAIIKNGNYGLWVDSLGSPGMPMLTLKNTIIQNMTSDGIFAYGSSINSVNCVIADCGGYAIDVEYGGSYDFRHLTIGNYWYSTVRHVPSLFFSNFAYDTVGNKYPNDLKCYFGNTILYGSNDEEIGMDSVASADFFWFFDHSMLKTKISVADQAHFSECTVNTDPKFVDITKLDYRIDSISPAIDKGIEIGVLLDILGHDRGTKPDLGAYEYFRQ